MNAATNEVLADSAVRKRLNEMGASTLGGTPKQLADHLAAEIEQIHGMSPEGVGER